MNFSHSQIIIIFTMRIAFSYKRIYSQHPIGFEYDPLESNVTSFDHLQFYKTHQILSVSQTAENENAEDENGAS